MQVSKKIEAQMHTQEEKQKEEQKRNGISMVWRKYEIVKIIYEYKTLI